ncbi:hypothetical protein RvY_05731 [Ramazzottius varieornatus]|uniref:C2 domain-containing protein n=1 Tax=Ramazzottius varieornatus TaxID=947166 RepID=A0A1D1V521_RAMVA|nr:hypothetical protein RvY_05731 [Ramazzottius varieornatus]
MAATQDSDNAVELVHHLEKLTRVEREQIRKVLERDGSVRKQQDDEFRTLKAEIEELQRARDAEIDFGLERNACSLCMMEFGHFFDRGAACPWCRRKVCKACRLCAYVQKKRRWMCTLCTKEWQLRKLSGDWLQVGKKTRMSNTSAAVVVLKSIVSMQFKQSASKDKKAVFLQESSSEANTSHKIPKFGLGKEGKIGTDGHKQPQSDGLVVENLVKGSTASLMDKVRDCIHHAKGGILHVQSEAMVYLKTHTVNRTAVNGITPRPLTLSQESSVGQPDFSAGLATSRDEFFTAHSTENLHKKGHSFSGTFSYTSSHFLAHTEKGNMVTSTPRKDSPHVNGTYLIPNVVHHDLSFSSLTSELECQAVGSTAHTGGDVELRVELDYEMGTLNVTIFRCRNLPSAAKSSSKMPDAYVKVFLCGSKGGRLKQKTKVAQKGFNPVYDEVLCFSVTKEEVADWSLYIKVCYKDRRFSHAFKGGSFRTAVLGETTVMITNSLLDAKHPTWLKLHRK